MANDEGDALTAALEATPEVQREAIRRTVRMVLAAHLAELANDGGDSWPAVAPSEALSMLSIGESSTLDHADAVADRLLAQVGRSVPPLQ